MSKPITTLALQKYKRDGRKIVALTAYDYSMAKILDQANVDVILVGDSLAMVVMGERTTHSVTMEEMLHHTKAVSKGVQNALVVADLPFMSYQVDVTQAISNAGRFIKEARAHAVKLEGATPHNLEIIRRLTGMGIPVMGHLGYTPQAIYGLGGARVQGRSANEALRLIDEALAVEAAGCFSVVLEMMPTAIAKAVSEKLSIPTIGIGAGNVCDGQILVIDDLLGKFTDFQPRFVRRYANLSQICQDAVLAYAVDVKSADFPNESESFLLPKAEEEEFLKVLENRDTACDIC
jgi:3-methyl-2-oxobutanoate hydroxymethyltransferase